MPLPRPEPGLVIPYAYLWRHERNKGLDEVGKTRPCVIVLATNLDAAGATRVLVAPVTHSKPAGEAAIEMPPRVKRELGLDAERSWIVLDEVNRFVWPGFDLRPVPGTKDRFSYGFIPPKLYDRIIARILDLAAKHRLTAIGRD